MLKLLILSLTIITAFAGISAEVKAQAAIGIAYHKLFSSIESDFSGYETTTNRAMGSILQSGSLLKLHSTLAWNQRNAFFASVSFSNLNAKAISSYREFINVGGELYSGEIEFMTEYEIESLAFAAGNRFQAIDNLFLSAGVQMNYAINDNYYQKEYIKYPADRGVFTQTGSRTKNEVSSSLPDISNLYLSALLVANYKLPLSLNNKLYADISIAYGYQLTSLSTSYDIKIHNFDIGIGISYYISGSQQKYIGEEDNNPQSSLNTRLSISALSKAGFPIEQLLIDTGSLISNPSEIVFRSLVVTDEEIEKWNLIIIFADNELKRIKNAGNPPAEFGVSLSTEEIQSILNSSETENLALEYYLEIVLNDNRIVKSQKGIITLKIE